MSYALGNNLHRLFFTLLMEDKKEIRQPILNVLTWINSFENFDVLVILWIFSKWKLEII